MRKISAYLAAIFVLFLAVWAVLVFFKKAQQKKNDIRPAPIPFAFEEPHKLDFPDNSCNIKDYGAISDGTTLNTQAFQKAIADCSRKGGGKVVVPSGKWLTGAIHLQSRINLNIEKDAEIIFSSDPADYLPAVFSRFEGIELFNYSPFIYAADVENVAITGQGLLNGQGQSWLNWKKTSQPAIDRLYAMAQKNTPVAERIFATQKDSLRPSFIQFINSKNIELSDFSITNSPMWTVHSVYSENILVNGININTHGHNTDGIVIDSSKNVLIENSVLRTGDDSIAIKSGLDQDGWRVNLPSENIVVKNCDISDGHSGIAIGSEMSGGVRNVLLQDLKFNGIDQGVRVKSILGRGGIVENVWARNITLGEVANAAFQADLNYDSATVESINTKAPVLKNFYIDGLTVEKTKYAVNLEGLQTAPISDLSFMNIKATAERGILIKNCKDIRFESIKISGVKKAPTFNIVDSQNIQY